MTNLELLNLAKKKYKEFNPVVFNEILYGLSPKIKDQVSFISLRDQAVDFSVRKFFSQMDAYFICHRPLNHILKSYYFNQIKFILKNKVLSPRDVTEIMTNDFIKQYQTIEEHEIYDLCCGSGCIGLAIKKNCPQHRLFLVDKYYRPYHNTLLNKRRLHLDVTVIKKDVFKFLKEIPWTTKTVIISNPPYLASHEADKYRHLTKYEDKHCFFAPKNGLFFYERYFWYLSQNDFFECWLEIGFDQHEKIKQLIDKTSNLLIKKHDQQNNYLVIWKKNTIKQ